MAEFCLECWNKLNGFAYSPECVCVSEEPDFCEGCGEWKPVIVGFKRRNPAVEWFRERWKGRTKERP